MIFDTAIDAIIQNGIAFAVLVLFIVFLYKDREYYRLKADQLQKEKDENTHRLEKDNERLHEKIKILENLKK